MKLIDKSDCPEGPAPRLNWPCRSNLCVGTKLRTFRWINTIYVTQRIINTTHFHLQRINAHTMSREEDLLRIAKKLDKMVSRNNMVRS